MEDSYTFRVWLFISVFRRGGWCSGSTLNVFWWALGSNLGRVTDCLDGGYS
jgi:hypothetical protein